MELQQLRYFLRVAETGSFTRAAEDLFIAQPSLSKQIRRLERSLGFALFTRGPAGTKLTSEGEILVHYARSVLDRLADVETAAEEIRHARRGRVTLAIIPHEAIWLVPGLLKAANERFPGITIQIQESLDRRQLIEFLDTGEADLATLHLPVGDPRLVWTTILDEHFVLVLPKDHRLADRDEVHLVDLRDEPFVLPGAGYDQHHRVVRVCEQAGFQPNFVVESHDAGVIQSLVAAGFGVAILPTTMLRHDIDTVVRPIVSEESHLIRHVGLAFRGDRYVSIATRQVFALAQELDGR